MNIQLQYTVEFLSDWHVGSGLDSGTHVDALVAKTEDGLPLIPGKTIKGLLRDAMQDMIDGAQLASENIDSIFGTKSKTNSNDTNPGNAFFSNAYLSEQEKKEILPHLLHSYLYRVVTSTKINENGTAQSGSLRSIEVCSPLQLTGTIKISEEKDFAVLEKAAKLVRHLGVQRNRGLGRCRFSITKKSNS